MFGLLFVKGGIMELYLIAGYARAGKNYFANYLKEEFEKKQKRVCILRITGPLYHYAYDHFGWNGKEEEKPRSFLQKMGIEHIKEKLQMPHFLIDRLSEDIMVLDSFFDIGIITDGRLKAEIEELEKRYPNIKKIHIKRENYNNNLTAEQQKHITEQDLENYNNFDFEIENKNYDSLKKKAKEIVEERIKN